MSEIYIKGMKMPKKDGVLTLRIWGSGQVERLESYHSWLLSGVKAASFPPHGRLGDFDEFLNRAFGTGLFNEDDMRLLQELVGGSSIIIPANEEGE